MKTWRVVRRAAALSVAGAAVVIGVSLTSSPASAQETIVCVGNKTSLVRIVEDEFDCKFWEHAQTIGGGDGSSVKLVFATSTTYQGNIGLDGQACQPGFDCSTGIGRARSECNRLAGAVGLPGEYEPWLSTDADPAGNRFDALGADGPWFNVKGELVAASLAGLLTLKNGTDYLYNAVHYSELGIDVSTGGMANTRVYTGTFNDGTSSGINCDNWQNNVLHPGGSFGVAINTDISWVDDTITTDCGLFGRLYCFQQ